MKECLVDVVYNKIEIILKKFITRFESFYIAGNYYLRNRRALQHLWSIYVRSSWYNFQNIPYTDRVPAIVVGRLTEFNFHEEI